MDKRNKKNESASQIQQSRYDYWVEFQEYAFKNQKFSKCFNRRKPSIDSWMNFSIGSSACHISISQIRQRNELVIELYIDNDKVLFNNLLKNKNEIEKETELTFDWRELPNRKASSIVIEKAVDFDNKKQWNSQFDWLIETMIKMRNTFKKHI